MSKSPEELHYHNELDWINIIGGLPRSIYMRKKIPYEGLTFEEILIEADILTDTDPEIIQTVSQNPPFHRKNTLSKEFPNTDIPFDVRQVFIAVGINSATGSITFHTLMELSKAGIDWSEFTLLPLSDLTNLDQAEQSPRTLSTIRKQGASVNNKFQKILEAWICQGGQPELRINKFEQYPQSFALQEKNE